eukprot:1160670-Pelagomonas_calceolata.AAC.2
MASCHAPQGGLSRLMHASQSCVQRLTHVRSGHCLCDGECTRDEPLETMIDRAACPSAECL